MESQILSPQTENDSNSNSNMNSNSNSDSNTSSNSHSNSANESLIPCPVCKQAFEDLDITFAHLIYKHPFHYVKIKRAPPKDGDSPLEKKCEEMNEVNPSNRNRLKRKQDDTTKSIVQATNKVRSEAPGCSKSLNESFTSTANDCPAEPVTNPCPEPTIYPKSHCNDEKFPKEFGPPLPSIFCNLSSHSAVDINAISKDGVCEWCTEKSLTPFQPLLTLAPPEISPGDTQKIYSRCKWCPEEFQSPQEVALHDIKNHFKNYRLKCHECLFFAATADWLASHMIFDHQSMFICPYCSQLSTTRADFVSHVTEEYFTRLSNYYASAIS